MEIYFVSVWTFQCCILYGILYNNRKKELLKHNGNSKSLSQTTKKNDVKNELLQKIQNNN